MTEPDQRWDPARYAATAAFVPAYGEALLDVLDPQPGERVLDLGCGDGALTALLAERGAEVVGVDASPEMVAAARRRGIDAHVADAQALAFDGGFDAVLSNAVLHWVPDQAAVIAGVRRALRPGGRYVAEMGGLGNVAAIGIATVAVLAARGIEATNPWTNPSPAEQRARLEAGGFEVVAVDHFPRLTPLPDSLAAWLDVFGEPLLGSLDPATRAAVTAEVEALASPWLGDGQRGWVADYVRLRTVAVAV